MLPVIRRNTWPAFEEPFAQLRREMDSLFDRAFGGDGGALSQAWSSVPCTIWEDEDQFTIELDLPGLTEKDVAVTLEGKHLTIKGERKLTESANYTRRERGFGSFERVFHLPDDVDVTKIEAKAHNGVLTLRLPKAEAAKPKTINVVSD